LALAISSKVGSIKQGVSGSLKREPNIESNSQGYGLGLYELIIEYRIKISTVTCTFFAFLD